MKKIKSCISCGRAVPKSLAYHGEMEKFYTNPISGKTETETLVGVLCPVCNKRLGYRTSKKKLEKFKGGTNDKS